MVSTIKGMLSVSLFWRRFAAVLTLAVRSMPPRLPFPASWSNKFISSARPYPVPFLYHSELLLLLYLICLLMLTARDFIYFVAHLLFFLPQLCPPFPRCFECESFLLLKLFTSDFLRVGSRTSSLECHAIFMSPKREILYNIWWL